MPSTAVGGPERLEYAYRVMGTGLAVVRTPTDRGESAPVGPGQARRFDMYPFGFFRHVVHWSFSVCCFFDCDTSSLADVVPE